MKSSVSHVSNHRKEINGNTELIHVITYRICNICYILPVFRRVEEAVGKCCKQLNIAGLFFAVVRAM